MSGMIGKCHLPHLTLIHCDIGISPYHSFEGQEYILCPGNVQIHISLYLCIFWLRQGIPIPVILFSGILIEKVDRTIGTIRKRIIDVSTDILDILDVYVRSCDLYLDSLRLIDPDFLS